MFLKILFIIIYEIFIAANLYKTFSGAERDYTVCDSGHAVFHT